MKEYIATFYTHFGAVSFNRKMKTKAGGVKMMPVPRALSSSCGTCVFFTLPPKEALPEELSEEDFPVSGSPDLEAVYEVKEKGYTAVYRAKEPS